jgi:leader peptidase (prepilin peptidase)/N-methyltransferase
LGLILLDIIRIIASFALQVEAMGDGDPKLTAMIGVWLGWKYLLLSIFLACLIGAITGIFSGKLNQRQIIPFGPFLAIGALLTVFWGNEIIFRYVKLFFSYS